METLETQEGESGVGVRSNRAFPNQNVRGASAASLFLFENPLFDQILNVPQRRVVRSLRQFPPLFRCQFPSKPSSNRLMIFLCRSLTSIDSCLRCRQNASLARTPAVRVFALAMARPRQSRNQTSHSVTSRSPFCVDSRIS